MVRANVEGSANVIARRARGPASRRVVHTSSASAIGEPHGTVGREDSPHRGSFLSSYERSKYLAERRVLALGRESRRRRRLREPLIRAGPGTDRRLRAPAARSGQRAAPRARRHATISIVDIDDCTQAHLLAAERGRAGERYLVSGATLTCARRSNSSRRIAAVPDRVRIVPPRASATVAGTAAEPARASRRRDPPICREAGAHAPARPPVRRLARRARARPRATRRSARRSRGPSPGTRSRASRRCRWRARPEDAPRMSARASPPAPGGRA